MDIAIIEDEKYIAELIERFCKQYDSDNQIVKTIANIEDSIKWFSAVGKLPDLVFMDVQLTDGLSFEIFEKINMEVPVIFVTAYDDYAIRAFKLNSIDYILKPFDFDDIKKAFEKYHKLKESLIANSNPSFEKLFTTGNKPYKSRFLIKTGEHYKFITTSTIAYFLFEDGVVMAKMFDKSQQIVNESLDELELVIDPLKFYRINRKLIVSIDAISNIQSYFNRRLSIRLIPGNLQELVSRERVSGFKVWMNL